MSVLSQNKHGLGKQTDLRSSPTSSPCSKYMEVSELQAPILKMGLELIKIAVQSHSLVRLFATPWTATRQAALSSTVSRILLRVMSMELVMPPNQLILSRPLLLLPSIFIRINVYAVPGTWYVK